MKKVRKVLPVSLYDVLGLEKWLEEQANAGLFPVRVDEWVTFTRTGVPGTRFRLEPCNGLSQPDTERLEHYRSAGWEYAFMIGIESLTKGIYFLFYTTDPTAVELYTDLQSRGLSLGLLVARIKKLRRRAWWILAITLAICAALIAMVLNSSSRFDVQPDSFSQTPLVLVQLSGPYMVLYFLLVAALCRRNYRDIRALRATVRALRDGVEPVSPGWRRSAAAGYVFTAVLTLFIVAAALMRIDALSPFMGIPLEDFSSPYVALQELESEPVRPWDDFFEDDSYSRHENYADREFSLLAPVWYSVTQEAFSPVSGVPARGDFYSIHSRGYMYSPDLDMTYFRLLIPAMARGVAEAQLETYRLVNIMWSYEEVDYPGLDFAILAKAEDSSWQMAAAGSGGQVAVFRYLGAEDLADHLEELAEIVTQ